eukprot:TRINITY_DN4661_c0_g1_i1.p1 TRINITY_DN4661_c0_g1~~TRINITY_DN4661_c0_g1_i1.p1  ORF type:complete len:313 (-),score=19.83 TRINITY_DN4661_c0_g1_i1:187-1125(-)
MVEDQLIIDRDQHNEHHLRQTSPKTRASVAQFEEIPGSKSPVIQRIEKLKSYLPCLHEINERHLSLFLTRAITVSILLLSSLWLMSITVVLSGMRSPNNVPDLPDFGFYILPAFYENDTFSNKLLGVAGAITLLRCLFHRRGLTMIRRFAFLWTVLILGRCTTLLATSYPDPSRSCKAYKSPDNLFAFFLETVYRPEFITCGDLMYSGHTVYFTLLALSWSHYGVYWYEKYMWIPLGTSILSLVATRVHYLNDVLIAFYLTILVWYLYHLVATTPVLRKKYRIIAWLERDLILQEEEYENPGKVETANVYVS